MASKTIPVRYFTGSLSDPPQQRGWRNGVLMCITSNTEYAVYGADDMLWCINRQHSNGLPLVRSYQAIIFDRDCNEGVIVPLAQVRLADAPAPPPECKMHLEHRENFEPHAAADVDTLEALWRRRCEQVDKRMKRRLTVFQNHVLDIISRYQDEIVANSEDGELKTSDQLKLGALQCVKFEIERLRVRNG